MISTSDADDHAGVLTTFFIAAYTGLSIAVVALGIALQQVSPHTTLLIFALIVGLGLLTATPAMVRSPDANSKP